MKICVFLSSYEGSGSVLEAVDKIDCYPGAYTDQHTFEYRLIRKAHAKREIDAAVAEGFDFYFNFLWGTLDDPVAGVRESQYFESLGLPSCGIRSWERSRTKKDFFTKARLLGSPPVPGTDGWPLFVKPANGCASQLIDENSVCHNEAKLKNALQRINRELYGARIRRAEAMGIDDAERYAHSYNPTARDCDDIVVQEYIDGQDCTCTVVKMGEGCLALVPIIYKMRHVPSMKKKFLTFDLKFDEQTSIQLLEKRDDPILFERIQQVAIEAYRTSESNGGNMGCDVDLRIRPDGAVFAIEVNPQPAAFATDGTFQDLPIMHSLPGAHRSIINIFIMNQLLGCDQFNSLTDRVAQEYDAIAPDYNKFSAECSQRAGIRNLVNDFDFGGTVFDLACGTGLFGQILSGNQNWSDSRNMNRLLGFDISPLMLAICAKTGDYDATHLGRMETTLIHFRRYAAAVDHIVCFAAAQFLRPEAFHLLLVLCFVLGNKSISISIDEIPEKYNKALESAGVSFMCQHNHIESMESFVAPRGWRLKRRVREYSWTSPKTGDDVYATYFRFEREENGSRDLMFSGEAVAN